MGVHWTLGFHETNPAVEVFVVSEGEAVPGWLKKSVATTRLQAIIVSPLLFVTRMAFLPMSNPLHAVYGLGVYKVF